MSSVWKSYKERMSQTDMYLAIIKTLRDTFHLAATLYTPEPQAGTDTGGARWTCLGSIRLMVEDSPRANKRQTAKVATRA